MEPGSLWPEVARLLERLANLTEQQPDEDDPAFVFSYVPRSQLGPDHEWEVNLSLGPTADDVWIRTGGNATQVLRDAIEALEQRLEVR